MEGIDLNSPVFYKHAALRYFKKGEHHVTRFCEDNVLLLVYEGVLRFSENGELKEVRAGEYYVQRKNCYQAGERVSDAPKYLYVHFDAEWAEGPFALPGAGVFDVSVFHEWMEKMDAAARQEVPLAKRQYLLLKLLLSLKGKKEQFAAALKMAEYIEAHLSKPVCLADLCREFHYSKNYIIRLFQKEFGVSAVRYINGVKLSRAAYLLETTSLSAREIALQCGFSDYPYFYRCFVQNKGCSPVEWRTRIRQNPLLR